MNDIMPYVVTLLDLEIAVLSEVSQRKTNIVWHRLYMELKKGYKWNYLQKRNRVANIEN